ncbi:hypothetical protein EQW78_15610 [Oerskovia turbata]|uniref:Uncharacterized protein n=1 Tax=Oerskovia turbata TaxID=1713 RepID=A0A4Q1KR41_9CELL|nr:hypothetical protein [Oerskovia turbata]RXR22041.1 hypothetical protein EQW73_16970 [Oerskovia turbata]RXR32000.1 hypothetical protein EQW78_15610 [Oerskovia turbata]TGJ96891.1 hypothetical protein DLJ96_02195 [Actinotalea fermentans ATCC 43279 = JCM 9966 = DSM 3133]
MGIIAAPPLPAEPPVETAEQPAPQASTRTVSLARTGTGRGSVVPTSPLVIDETLEPLAAYDQAKREQAEQHGEPTDRSTAPGVLPGQVEEETGPLTPLVAPRV